VSLETIRMRSPKIFVLVWLLFLPLSAQADTGLPTVHWEVSTPLTLVDGAHHLSLGDTLAQVKAQLGTWAKPEQSLATFAGNVTVRVSEGRVVNLTLVGPPCPWSLEVDHQKACETGEKIDALQQRLGPPHARFTKTIPPEQSNVYLYYGALGDAGLLVVDGEVRSILLAEPGVLEMILPTAGYTKQP
jgi:hypothetical protein